MPGFSAGLRSVLITTKKIQRKNGEILMVSLHDTVKEIFEISGFNTIIPIHASVDAALETA
ncbi:MAG: STAS domain-containing protein [Deltaproteobacteria bacterium]|nr:STAS domain-containing protein [Deltaproteobacteria bacterium]